MKLNKSKLYVAEAHAEAFAKAVGGTVKTVCLPGYMGVETYYRVEWYTEEEKKGA